MKCPWIVIKDAVMEKQIVTKGSPQKESINTYNRTVWGECIKEECPYCDRFTGTCRRVDNGKD